MFDLPQGRCSPAPGRAGALRRGHIIFQVSRFSRFPGSQVPRFPGFLGFPRFLGKLGNLETWETWKPGNLFPGFQVSRFL